MFGSAWKRRSLSVEWPLPAGILKSQIFVFLWPDEDEDMPASGEHKHSEGSTLKGTKSISSTTFSTFFLHCRNLPADPLCQPLACTADNQGAEEGMVHPYKTHPDYDAGRHMALWSLFDAWY